MSFTTDEDVRAIIEHECLSDGDFMGSINEWGVPIDWDIKEKNKNWHKFFFTRRAVYDHQAKGNCTFCQYIIRDMEKEGWLQKGDIILDPMCGIGSFNIVAALSGYDSIGVELEEVFYEDMVGYDSHGGGGDDDDLFANFPTHVEGSVERFLRLTKEAPAVGDILIVRGDARDLMNSLSGYSYPCKKAQLAGESVWKPLRQGQVICSPPYGNRMRDEGQRCGSKDGKDWSEMEDGKKQYSLDKENIGGAKISVVSSPPYGRSTEHSEKQIKSLDKPGSGFHGHRGFKYGEGNIAILQDNRYSWEMLKVYRSMYEVLEPGAHVALITRNFIQDFKVVELDVLTIDLMVRAGFCYIKTKRARLPELSMFKHMNYTKYHKDKGLPKIDWEEVTFFVKPDRAL